MDLVIVLWPAVAMLVVERTRRTDVHGTTQAIHDVIQMSELATPARDLRQSLGRPDRHVRTAYAQPLYTLAMEPKGQLVVKLSR